MKLVGRENVLSSQVFQNIIAGKTTSFAKSISMKQVSREMFLPVRFFKNLSQGKQIIIGLILYE